jgi:choline dehydrogenase-like flavoprotein
VTLLLHASVVELATGEDPRRVDRVEVRREDGSRVFVRARLVVLAAGGIENPRLLLLSRRAHRRGSATTETWSAGSSPSGCRPAPGTSSRRPPN